MTLGNLLDDLPRGVLRPLTSIPTDAPVAHIDYDSRRVAAGSVFVALHGVAADGHTFLPGAVAQGALAVVGDDEAALRACGGTAFLTANSRRAIAELASSLYGHPSRQMHVVGVTGTNGKTTTVHLIERLTSALGYRSGRVGTLGVRIGSVEEEGLHTTPEAPDFQATLRRMADAGVQRVATEVSSHALSQDRTWGTAFSTVAFTNLTQDHLDYHIDMESYFAAKRRLFSEYEPRDGACDVWSVINIDDPFGERLYRECSRPAIAYGLGEFAQLRATNVSPAPHSISFVLNWAGQSHKVRLRLPGIFNVYNALTAVGTLLACKELGSEALPRIVDALQSLAGAPGRFESVDEGQPFAVLVDYAHTPDALENVLKAARKITEGRVLAVFGCGGDRDRTKRPKMGRIAVDNADIAFATSDNPRTENPDAIIAEICEGLAGASNYTVDADRRSAIRAAISEAKPGDTVVIAGKGHEDYQIVGTVKHHFDDREEARAALKDLLQ